MSEGETSQTEATNLLIGYSRGKRDGLDELFPVVYDELKRLACGHLSGDFLASGLNTRRLNTVCLGPHGDLTGCLLAFNLRPSGFLSRSFLPISFLARGLDPCCLVARGLLACRLQLLCFALRIQPGLIELGQFKGSRLFCVASVARGRDCGLRARDAWRGCCDRCRYQWRGGHAPCGLGGLRQRDHVFFWRRRGDAFGGLFSGCGDWH